MARDSTPWAEAPSTQASLKQMLQQIASEVAGGGAIDSETPLMDSGARAGCVLGET